MPKPEVISMSGCSIMIYCYEIPQEYIKKLKNEGKANKAIVKATNKNKKLYLINKRTRYRS